MGAIMSFVGVLALVLIAILGAKANLHLVFGVLFPYAAVLTLLIGLTVRVVRWAKSPVPFRIPTTCGQQKSLPWIKHSRIENPTTIWGVLVRMFFEVFLFRSLFRNTKIEMHKGPHLAQGSSKWLWMAGLAFHWSFLIILIRHLRFFTEEVPFAVSVTEYLDSFLQIGVPLLYMTDLVILGAITFLYFRRVIIPQVSYISLPADYFPLVLIFSIAGSGVLMRYFTKTHIVGVKAYTMSLVSLRPMMSMPEGVGTIFWVHLFLVCVLFVYFPWSKLVHMAGVFMSPTRNMANNSRIVRHVNPWQTKYKGRTYVDYENDFREKMISVGVPVEKQESESAEPAAEKE